MTQIDLNSTVSYYSDQIVSSSTTAFRVTVFDGESEPKEYDLSSFGKNIITFGRDPSNDIVITSKFVSRMHGRFIVDINGCTIEDANSKNGLIYDGHRIKRKVLLDGDNIRVDDSATNTNKGVLLLFTGSSSSDEWNSYPIDPSMNIFIGRDPACNICLDHVSVSNRHARIYFENGKWILVDTASTNGIYVNGRKVQGRYFLREKDLILITNSKLIFENGRITWRCFKQGIGIEACNLIKRVERKKVILDDVNLSILPGEMVAIVGGSGAGKSTVMNCMCGYSMPTEGQVLANGVDLYDNYEILKQIIGYVPQQDIVYENLTVYDMLFYAAELRLPEDTAKAERDAAVVRVMEAVDLANRRNVLIRRLSGGQRKRASIAVELLSDPNLFFLDEPASGLDPGTERNLMMTLKKMTDTGKTVVFVTHSTLNLGMCDKIVFMGAGGKLCFYGTLKDALKFFNVEDSVDIYNLIAENPEAWNEKYRSEYYSPKQIAQQGSVSAHSRIGHRISGQLSLLCRRNLRLIFNDKIRLLMLLVQAPVLAFLISLVTNGNEFIQYEFTKSLLFALSCSAFWIGILNSIQEVCKERNILRREYMTGLRLDSYILSKLITLGLVCAVQSVLLTSVFAAMVGIPEEGVVFGAFAEMLLTTFLTALGATALGLLVSSLFKNADRAMTLAPLLLMPQLLFSGLIFPLEGASKIISYLAICRFSMEGFGTTANLNNLELRIAQEGFPVVHEAEEFFEYTAAHFLSAQAILLVYVVVFAVLAGIVLKRIKSERG